jgi:mannitol-1-/sugar-/sorbitol-6-phosphatase
LGTIEFDCSAILFDLDGVLVDSAAYIERRWQLCAEKHDLDLEAILRVAHGRRSVDTIRLVAPHLQAEAEAARFAEYDATDTNGITVVEGAAQLLRSLPGNAWAIATSGPRETALARLADAGLPSPPVLVTADDVQHGKPDPEPYLLAARLLGAAPSDCVVIEDAPTGVQAGQAAGMRVIAVASTHPVNELTGAAAVARHLVDIQVVAPAQADSPLTVRVTDARGKPPVSQTPPAGS